MDPFRALSLVGFVTMAAAGAGGCGDTEDGPGSTSGGGGETSGDGDSEPGGDGDASSPTFCSSDKDCRDAGGICDTTRSSCVDCLSATDCGENQLCRAAECISVTVCSSTKDCPTDEVCADALGYCVECEADADCATDQQCVANVCAVSCESDKDCRESDGVCDVTLGVCVDCASASDCSDGEYCTESGTCEAQLCRPGDVSCNGDSSVVCTADGSGFTTRVCSAGCDEDSGECEDCEGDEGCDCYPNDTCNDDLACLSGLCVDPSSPGTGGTSGTGGGASTGGDSGTGGAPADCPGLDASVFHLDVASGECLQATVDIYWCTFSGIGCEFTVNDEVREGLLDNDVPQGGIYRFQGDCRVVSCTEAESCCVWNEGTNNWDGCEAGCP